MPMLRMMVMMLMMMGMLMRIVCLVNVIDCRFAAKTKCVPRSERHLLALMYSWYAYLH